MSFSSDKRPNEWKLTRAQLEYIKTKLLNVHEDVPRASYGSTLCDTPDSILDSECDVDYEETEFSKEPLNIKRSSSLLSQLIRKNSIYNNPQLTVSSTISTVSTDSTCVDNKAGHLSDGSWSIAEWSKTRVILDKDNKKECRTVEWVDVHSKMIW
jgi:hypothetical protein